jgi:hypothetical protein
VDSSPYDNVLPASGGRKPLRVLVWVWTYLDHHFTCEILLPFLTCPLKLIGRFRRNSNRAGVKSKDRDGE